MTLRRGVALALGLLQLLVAFGFWFVFRPVSFSTPRPIAQGFGFCRVPSYIGARRNATESSLIAVGNSLIAENNHGYDLLSTTWFGRTASGGVERIDFNPDRRSCRKVWSSPDISQTAAPKVSLETGLVYLYTKAPDAPLFIDACYLTAIDFASGETRFKVLTGTGVAYDNHWAPITLGPGRRAYVGTPRGLVLVRDRG